MLKSQITNEILLQSLKFWKFYLLDLRLMLKVSFESIKILFQYFSFRCSLSYICESYLNVPSFSLMLCEIVTACLSNHFSILDESSYSNEPTYFPSAQPY